jgi:hypothetical protein
VIVAEARLDLSTLGIADLQALRLGAQVMRHKAELAVRPRVEGYFSRLLLTLDAELARRRSVSDASPVVSLSSLPLAAPDAGTTTTSTEGTPSANRISLVEDRRVAAEYLDLLGANDRLSPAVRLAVRTLRENLHATEPGDA